MNRTVSLKLMVTDEQKDKLSELLSAFNAACNAVVPFVVENRCWNRVALHHFAYYKVREAFPALGSQMVCNVIRRVADAYKTLKANGKITKDKPIQTMTFFNGAVHYDKRTYSVHDQTLSLFTMDGRINVQYACGERQQHLLARGKPKEAELIYRNGQWFFNLVLDMPTVEPVSIGTVLGVDVGENNLAATSTGKIFGGKSLCHERDCYLFNRRRLQANGSRASKRKLRSISGREQRHVKHVNHEVSKRIIAEAIRYNVREIRMEDLTGIRDRIKAGKRVRTRLHRWAFRQLQDFIAYKAQAVGIKITFVKPAYTSQTCSVCGLIGTRDRHYFSCTCGNRRHSDVNAAVNIAGFAESIGSVRAAVNRPVFAHRGSLHVAAKSSVL